MRSLANLLAGLLLSSPAWAQDSCPAPSGPGLTVKTTTGTFTGFVNDTTPSVRQWLGIPFGKPPVGTKRFMPPEPASYGGELDAKSYKPICVQQSGTKTGIFWELVPEFQNQDPQSEDCLYLNIWAPPKPVAEKKKLPVIIWVCGGGSQEGGGHAPYQVPDHWIQRTQTHVVVTFNYRLNVFGFPGARAAPANVGMLDTRLVVEWARDNIAGFGGDPKRMIIWGQSAGGALVDYYSFAHPKDPIVTGYIASSGRANLSNPNPADQFSKLAAQLGCANMTAEAELACMQKVDAFAIQNILQNQTQSGLRFRPVVDNSTVFMNNTERLEKGLVAKIPAIMGNTVNENAAFGGIDTPPSSSPTLVTGIGCGVIVELDVRAKSGLSSYRYEFAGNFSNITPRWWLGAMHSSDIPVVFGTHHLFRGNSTELEWQTSFAMQDLWVSFAADSSKDPMSPSAGLTWAKYNANPSKMVVFGADNKGAQLVTSESVAPRYNCSGAS